MLLCYLTFCRNCHCSIFGWYNWILLFSICLSLKLVMHHHSCLRCWFLIVDRGCFDAHYLLFGAAYTVSRVFSAVLAKSPRSLATLISLINCCFIIYGVSLSFWRFGLDRICCVFSSYCFYNILESY